MMSGRALLHRRVLERSVVNVSAVEQCADRETRHQSAGLSLSIRLNPNGFGNKTKCLQTGSQAAKKADFSICVKKQGLRPVRASKKQIFERTITVRVQSET